ncbi:MAG: zinc dependent phospholipase C family protein [Eubacteriales bacterium]|nr:zinc dependent phospholipase C family protein [Eubacteriales bacterium]
MPSTYAHYRFGEQVRNNMEKEKQDIIARNIFLYRIGLHGPDLFFYYNPIMKNVINQIGSENHEMSGKEFFTRFLHVIENHKEDERYLAYAYGVLCHFALDRACHGYVEEKTEEGQVGHIEIETEFDRFLLLKDEKEPLSYHMAKHIRVEKEYAKVIAAFYPGTDSKAVLRSLRDFVFYHEILRAPRPLKRNLLYGLMKMVGVYDSFHGHIVNVTPNEYCVDSNAMLYSLYKKGRKEALVLFHEFELGNDYSKETEELLSYNFESKKGMV